MTETRHDLGVYGDDVRTLLDRWARHGLLTEEQVERITRFEQAAPAEPPQMSASASAPARVPSGRGSRLVVEALAYLGGVLALAAALLLVQMVWGDLSDAVRVAIPLGTSLALVLAGLLVPGDVPERLRLRSALWLLATGAWLGAAGVLGAEVLDWSGESTILFVGLAGVALALPMYLRERTATTQLGLFVTVAMSAGAVGAQARWDEPTWIGVGVWLVALSWFWLGERDVVPPATVARYAAAVALIVGALLMQGTLAGQGVSLVTVALLFTWGVRAESLGLLAVAALGTLQLVPAAVTYFFPDRGRLAVPLVLLAVGAALVGTAVTVTRRRARRQAEDEVPRSPEDASRR